MATALNPVWLLLLAVVAQLDRSSFQLHLTLSGTSRTLDEGSSLDLVCNVSLGLMWYSGFVLFKSNVSTTECVVWFENPCSVSNLSRCYCSSKTNSGDWTFRMNVQSVQVSDAQSWHCQLSPFENGSLGSSEALNVAVNGRPTSPTLSPSCTAVPVGGDVTLTCSSQPTSMPVGIRTPLEYTWKRGGVTIVGEASSILVLRNVEKVHKNNYTCSAKEAGKRLSSHTSNEVGVDVQYDTERSPPQEASVITWPAAIGIGLAIGCVISGLLAGVVFYLFVKRKHLTGEMPRADGGGNTYENLDARTRDSIEDNSTYQHIHLYEYPYFARSEQTNSNIQVPDKQDGKNQALEEATLPSHASVTVNDHEYLEVLP